MPPTNLHQPDIRLMATIAVKLRTWFIESSKQLPLPTCLSDCMLAHHALAVHHLRNLDMLQQGPRIADSCKMADLVYWPAKRDRPVQQALSVSLQTNNQHGCLEGKRHQAKGLSLVGGYQMLATALIVVFAAGERTMCYFWASRPSVRDNVAELGVGAQRRSGAKRSRRRRLIFLSQSRFGPTTARPNFSRVSFEDVKAETWVVFALFSPILSQAMASIVLSIRKARGRL